MRAIGTILGLGGMMGFLAGCGWSEPGERVEGEAGDIVDPAELRERAWSGGYELDPEIETNALGSELKVGMSWSEALAMLKSHGAAPMPLQVMGGFHFRLASGDALELNSPEEQFGKPETVSRMALCTYRPRSWESKVDPERMKFFQSFVEVEVLDLTKYQAD